MGHRGHISGVCRDCQKRTFFQRKDLNHVRQPRCSGCGGYRDVVNHVNAQAAGARMVRDGGKLSADAALVPYRKPKAKPKQRHVCSWCGHAMSSLAAETGSRCFLCRETLGKASP